jgi:hypothetical protein
MILGAHKRDSQQFRKTLANSVEHVLHGSFYSTIPCRHLSLVDFTSVDTPELHPPSTWITVINFLALRNACAVDYCSSRKQAHRPIT